MMVRVKLGGLRGWALLKHGLAVLVRYGLLLPRWYMSLLKMITVLVNRRCCMLLLIMISIIILDWMTMCIWLFLLLIEPMLILLMLLILSLLLICIGLLSYMLLTRTIVRCYQTLQMRWLFCCRIGCPSQLLEVMLLLKLLLMVMWALLDLLLGCCHLGEKLV